MPQISYSLFINNLPASAELSRAIQEVQVEENGELADIFRLRIAIGVTPSGEWSVLKDDLFHPLTPVKVLAQVGTAPGEVLINGYVTELHANLSDEPGEAVLAVVGMDPTVQMNLEEKVTPWANMADSDIATAIFAQYGFTPKVTPTQPLRMELETTVIQRETDIRFLRRLAARNGYLCYVEPDPLLGLSIGVFGPPDLQSPAQGILSVNLGNQTNVTGFQVRYETLLPTVASAAGVKASDKSTQQADVSAVDETLLGSDGALDLLKAGGVNPMVLPTPGLADAAELQTLAQAVVNRSAWAVSAEGELVPEGFGAILRAKRTVNVRGAGALFSGTYLVTQVLHTFSQADGYRVAFQLRRNALGLSGSENFLV